MSGVPREQIAACAAAAHGFPLALALIASAAREPHPLPCTPEVVAEALRPIRDLAVAEAQDDDQRAALFVAAVARLVTEQLLEAVSPGVARCFEWLLSLPFAERVPGGVALIPAYRGALASDLAWRHPARFGELLRRILRHVLSQLHHAAGWRRDHAARCLLHALRGDPALGLQVPPPPPATGCLRAAPAMDATILEIAREAGLDGWPGRWLRRHRQSFVVCTAPDDQILGWVCLLDVADRAMSAEGDPLVEAARSSLERHIPLRDRERAVLVRGWATSPDPDPGTSHEAGIFLAALRALLDMKRVAMILIACDEDSPWYLPLVRVTSAADLDEPIDVDGRRVQLFVLDARRRTLASWLDTLSWGSSLDDAVQPPVHDELQVLDQSTYFEAVRAALRDLHDDEALRQNALLHTRGVLARCEPSDDGEGRAHALRTQIVEAARAMIAIPRFAKPGHALHHTYVQPHGTQEVVAERLGLPFSTYRRHLRRGVERLADTLWAAEVGDDVE